MKILPSVLTKQEQILSYCKNLKHQNELILDLVRTGENIAKPEGWPSFPLRTEAEFLSWELFLASSDNFDFAVCHISVVGGRGLDEGEMASNICKMIFSPELASTLNWVGTENKKGLKKLKCSQCILDACSKQYKGAVVKKKMSKAISTWLRNRSKKMDNVA